MGYTQYFTVQEHSDKDWKKFQDASRKIVSNFDGKICSGDGKGTPIIDMESVWLNGDASKDEEYETLLINRTTGWSFCKTARKPYDAVVVAILMAGERIGILTWDSDGDNEEGAFDCGKKLLDSLE